MQLRLVWPPKSSLLNGQLGWALLDGWLVDARSRSPLTDEKGAAAAAAQLPRRRGVLRNWHRGGS